MSANDNYDAKKIIRITSGSFRDDEFSAQHDYGKATIAWKDFEILFAITFEKKGALSPYLLFYVKDQPVLYYIDGGTANYRVLLKHDFTGKSDNDFTLLVNKFQFYLKDGCIDTTIRDYLKGGSAFLPTFRNLQQKVVEFGESVRERALQASQAPDEEKAEKAEDFLITGSRRWEPGEVIDNRFKVQKCLQGGMGIVYIAVDTSDLRLFAIKTFQDQFLWNRKIIKMFVREAEVWVKLGKHRHIVEAKFVRNIDGKPYIFLEFIQGMDLNSLLKKEPLDIIVALDFAIQFCSGMMYANEKLGIIHRDVKPSNCMITEDGILKITDFGLVQIFHERTDKELKGKAGKISGDLKITQTGAFKGTIPYMAPERFRESAAEIQSDIYSFGVMLYEILTARKPIEGESIDEWMTKHLREVPRPPHRLNRKVPEDFSLLVMKCLEKEPSSRYTDFRELRTELLAIYEKVAGVTYPLEDEEEQISIEELLAEGASMEALGQHREALHSYERALRLDANSSQGWHGRARVLATLGRKNEAIKSFERAVALKPDNAMVWYDGGNFYFQSGDYREALRCYERSLQLDPKLAEVWNKKGLILDIADRVEEALKCYDEALKLNPRLADAWNNKGNLFFKKRNYNQATQCYDEALSINQRLTRSWYNKGNIAVICNSFQDALAFYQKAIDAEPDYTQAWMGKAHVYVRMNQLREARASVESALAVEPSNLTVLGLRANLLYTMGLFEEVVSCSEAIRAIDPKNAKALYGIAQALTRLYAFDRALHYAREALSIEPDNKINKELHDDIIRLIGFKRRALEPMRETAEVIRLRSFFTEFSQIFPPSEQKRTFWDRIKRKSPNEKQDPEERYARAREHFESDENNEALACIENCLQLDGQMRKAWELASMIFARLGDREKAEASMLNSLSLLEESGDRYYQTGDVMLRSGRHLEALQSYQCTLARDRGNCAAYMRSLYCMEEMGLYELSRLQALEMRERYWEEIRRRIPEGSARKVAAVISIVLGRYREALETLNGAGDQDSDPAIPALKGLAYEKLGDIQEEMKVYNDASRKFPGEPELLLLRGHALEREYRVQEAQRQFELFSEKMQADERGDYGKAVLFMRLSDYEESLRSINRVLEINPSSLRGWIFKGIHMKNKEKMEEALWAFNKASEQNPEALEALRNKGLMLLHLCRYRDAIACFDRMTELYPEDSEGWSLKAISHQKLDECEKSLECSARALTSNPRAPEAMTVLSCTLLLLGRDKEALLWINKALRMDSRYHFAWLNKGVFHMKENGRRDASAAFEKALEINPDYAIAWYNRGVLSALENRLDEAISSFDKSLLQNSRLNLSWYNRGAIQMVMKRYDEALKCFDQSLELNPRDVRAWCQKGIVLASLENYQEALKAFTRSIRLDPTMSEALVNKGITLVTMGRNEEAELCFDEAKQVSEEFSLKVKRGEFVKAPGMECLAVPDQFGPFLADNPDFPIREKIENTVRMRLHRELFPGDN